VAEPSSDDAATADAGDVVSRLRHLDSCAVSDALDQLGITTGVVTGIVPLTGPVRIAGRAVTVLLGPPRDDAPSHHLGAAAAEAAGRDEVIVVAHQGRRDCAGWGGNLSRAARRGGAAGTLVDGAARDVDEAVEIGYPVFAAGATPRTARRRAAEHAWGVTVVFGGVEVDRGDYVVADSTGVVIVRAADVERVLAAAETVAAKEAAMARDLAAGRPVTEVMGAGYERMLDPS
jgi:regulator of RNase E activity RraA